MSGSGQRIGTFSMSATAKSSRCGTPANMYEEGVSVKGIRHNISFLRMMLMCNFHTRYNGTQLRTCDDVCFSAANEILYPVNRSWTILEVSR